MGGLVINPGGGGSSSGTAGGSLAGTYPNPTIASSVALPGSPTTTTQAALDDSTKVATTAYVDGATPARVIVGGSLGATYTLAQASSPRILLTGTLTAATVAITTTGLIAGCDGTLELVQDVTGGRLLTINGSTVPIPATPSQQFKVTYQSPDGSSLYVQSGIAVSPAIVGTVTQSATPAIDTDNMNVASITALAQAITSMTTNLTGTPVDGQTLLVRLTDNGTARAITWGASFEASGGVALPTTTVTAVMLCVAFIWNTVTSKWRCIGVA